MSRQNKALFLVFFLLLLGTVSAQLPDCEHNASEGKYLKAAECYKEAEEWNYCTFYYLKHAQKSEIAWDRAKGDASAINIAINYYYPEHADVRECVTNHGDTQLQEMMTEYREWLQNYAFEQNDPPFNMGAIIDGLNATLYAPPDECQTDADCDDGIACTKNSCSGSPKTCSVEPVTECINTQSDGCCPKECDESNDYDCAECHQDVDCPEPEDGFEYICFDGVCKEIKTAECEVDADCIPESGASGYRYSCVDGTCKKETDNSYWIIIGVVTLAIFLLMGIGAIFLFVKVINKKRKSQPPTDKEQGAQAKPPTGLQAKSPTKLKEIKAGSLGPVATKPSRTGTTPKTLTKPAPTKKPKKKNVEDMTEEEASEELEKIIKSVEELSNPKK